MEEIDCLEDMPIIQAHGLGSNAFGITGLKREFENEADDLIGVGEELVDGAIDALIEKNEILTFGKREEEDLSEKFPSLVNRTCSSSPRRARVENEGQSFFFGENLSSGPTIVIPTETPLSQIWKPSKKRACSGRISPRASSRTTPFLQDSNFAERIERRLTEGEVGTKKRRTSNGSGVNTMKEFAIRVFAEISHNEPIRESSGSWSIISSVESSSNSMQGPESISEKAPLEMEDTSHQSQEMESFFNSPFCSSETPEEIISENVFESQDTFIGRFFGRLEENCLTEDISYLAEDESEQRDSDQFKNTSSPRYLRNGISFVQY